MRNAFAIIFLLAITICGQMSSTVFTTESKVYQTNEFSPYIFEPYQARYKMETKMLGMDFNLLQISTDIREEQDQWKENFKIKLGSFGEVDIALFVDSDVDLKTGILKKQTFQTGESTLEVVFENDKVILTNTKEKKTEKLIYLLKEKIYPCFFSLTLNSYLPLNDNFSSSFTCFLPDFDNIKKSSLHLLNLKVTGSEVVSTSQGNYNCYVIKGDAVPLRVINGVDKPKKNNNNLPQIFSTVWIDKKTNKMIKALSEGKWGKRFFVLEE